MKLSFDSRNVFGTTLKSWCVTIIPTIWIEYDNFGKFGKRLSFGIDFLFWMINVTIEYDDETIKTIEP